MPGPARAGAFVYALDLERVASFYQQLLSMRLLHGSSERWVLESPDLQLLIHAIPTEQWPAAGRMLPVVPRHQTVKLFFTVPNLAAAAALAVELGGGMLPERYAGPGFQAANAYDPEGNVLQLREQMP